MFDLDIVECHIKHLQYIACRHKYVKQDSREDLRETKTISKCLHVDECDGDTWSFGWFKLTVCLPAWSHGVYRWLQLTTSNETIWCKKLEGRRGWNTNRHPCVRGNIRKRLDGGRAFTMRKDSLRWMNSMVWIGRDKHGTIPGRSVLGIYNSHLL